MQMVTKMSAGAAALGAALAGASWAPAQAQAQCFDKATLSYIDCPQPPPPPPLPVKPPAPEDRWDGFYLGLHAGYAFGSNEIELRPTSDAFSQAAFGAGFIPESLDNDDLDSFLAGGQIGYNHQIDNVVLGVEGDFAWMDMFDRDRSGVTAITQTSFFNQDEVLEVITTERRFEVTETTGVDWLATLRGRLGIAVIDDLLLFATGGLAFADVSRDATGREVGVSSYGYSDDEIRFGWTVGGGLEYALSERFSVRGDYLYVDLGSEDGTAASLDAGALGQAPSGLFSDRDDLTLNVVRIALNYRL